MRYLTFALTKGRLANKTMDVLEKAGITIYAGNSGKADMAVIKYLKGELIKNSDANCDHHHE